MTEADIPTLSRQHTNQEDAGEFGWFGFADPDRVARRIREHTTIADDRGNLAVVDDGDQLVGEVSWIRVVHSPPPNGYAWNIGVWIVPEHRGRGHGSEAQRQLAAYLLDHTYLERVEASTEADNVGEQRALEKAGFTREGVLRRACFRGGVWRDMVMYSKLRGEP
jgi:RimJ/RimL family protein N-acetyltransferase